MGAERDRMATRAVSAATIGTALEWFDFTLYGAVSATVLPKLFFPTMDATTALLASLPIRIGVIAEVQVVATITEARATACQAER